MICIFVSVVLWGLLHSLLASDQVKQFTHHRLGERGARHYRLGYNLFACVSFLPVLALTALTADRRLYLVPLPWSAIMVVGQVLAVAVLVIGFLQTDAYEFLGFRQAAGPLESRAGSLVTSGLYRYVRHPLYSAGLAFIWLMPLMTKNVLAINIGLTVYIIAGTIFEEQKLRLEFGEAYKHYSTVTPMFIPFARWNKR
jgi:methanethiol S-methyltransferase